MPTELVFHYVGNSYLRSNFLICWIDCVALWLTLVRSHLCCQHQPYVHLDYNSMAVLVFNHRYFDEYMKARYYGSTNKTEEAKICMSRPRPDQLPHQDIVVTSTLYIASVPESAGLRLVFYIAGRSNVFPRQWANTMLICELHLISRRLHSRHRVLKLNPSTTPREGCDLFNTFATYHFGLYFPASRSSDLHVYLMSLRSFFLDAFLHIPLNQ